MSRKLFLDDVRNPPDSTWDVVRSYTAFCEYLQLNGLPDVISFDHDLADEHYEIGAPSNYQQFDYEKCSEKTGMHCARFMLDNFGLPKEWRVHSANPCGRANIESLLRTFAKIHDAEEPTR